MTTPRPALIAITRRRPRSRRLLAVLVALAVLVPLLGPAPSAAAAGRHHARTKAEAAMARNVLHMLNRERRAHHRKPLHMRTPLKRSARGHDREMARYDEMSHQLPGEAFLTKRIARTGYHWVWAGENVAWNSRMNTTGVRQLERMMYTEKPPDNGHRRNILSRHFRDVGIDVYLDSRHHKVWLTTDFGRR